MYEYAFIWNDLRFMVVTDSICDALDAGVEYGVELNDDYFVMPEYLFDYYTNRVH